MAGIAVDSTLPMLELTAGEGYRKPRSEISGARSHHGARLGTLGERKPCKPFRSANSTASPPLCSGWPRLVHPLLLSPAWPSTKPTCARRSYGGGGMKLHGHIGRLVLEGLSLEKRHGELVEATVQRELPQLVKTNWLAQEFRSRRPLSSRLTTLNQLSPHAIRTQWRHRVTHLVYKGLGS
jgi:hypothetical protein